MPYRQDDDFYYLTGWNEPGAALLIAAEDAKAPTARSYTEILLLPTRDLRLEKYTGVKLDAATPGAPQTAGVDAVKPMTDLPAAAEWADRCRPAAGANLWAQPDAPQAKAFLGFTAVTLGGRRVAPHDVTGLTPQLRMVKDAGEIALLRKARDASIRRSGR